MARKTDYRKIYKDYYGIEFSNEYQIHHLDLDRTNNEIWNLLLLPKKLHQQYHFFLNATMPFATDKPFERVFDARICGNLAESSNYSRDMLQRFADVLDECAKWYDYKLYLEGCLDNIHHIHLEGGKK